MKRPNRVHSVTGYPVSGGTLADKASAYQLLHSKSQASISATTKLVDLDGVIGASAGDAIEYTIELKNTGTTTIWNIEVSDKILDGQIQRWEKSQPRCAKTFVSLLILLRA